MKILLDMNIPMRYSALLKERNIHAIRWSDVGSPAAEDSEIMAYARTNYFIVMTCDLDFSTILSVTHDLKPSIVQIRGSVIHAEKSVDVIIMALHKYEKELENGAILSIDSKNSRVRILPL